MEIKLTAKPTKVSEISSTEFNVYYINSIAKEHRGLRQESKSPT
jgi:hypothetical protein